MTPEQVSHVEGIADEAKTLILAKYAKGQTEHGGNLWQKPSLFLINQAINEAVDQIVYLLILKEQYLHGYQQIKED